MGGFVAKFSLKKKNEQSERCDDEIGHGHVVDGTECHDDEAVNDIFLQVGAAVGVQYQIYKQSLLEGSKNEDKKQVSEKGNSELTPQYIRLLNKDKFLKHPLIHESLRELEVLILESHLSLDELTKQWKIQPSQRFWETFIHFQSRRAHLEKLLLWNCNQQDSLFELFELSKCPEYTFFSHRYTPKTCVGLHGELIIYLSQCHHNYIWFDMGCVLDPQCDNNDNDMNDNKDNNWINSDIRKKLCMQRSLYCKNASSFSGYYITSGLLQPQDSLQFQQQSHHTPADLHPTDGLLSLCVLSETHPTQITTPPKINYSRLNCDLQRSNSIYKNTLPCLFDDIFTSHLLKSSLLGSFLPFVSYRTPLSLRLTPTSSSPPSPPPPPPPPLSISDDNNQYQTPITTNSSSSCKDLMESLTSQLYSQKYLPAIFTNETFYCLDPLTGRWVPGLSLPHLQSLATLPSFPTTNSSSQSNSPSDPPLISYGWSYYKESEIWLLNIAWKSDNQCVLESGDIVGDICLHLHHKCLVTCRDRVILFNPLKSTMQSLSTLLPLEEMTSLQDNSSSSSYSPSSSSLLSLLAPLPCLLCRRVINPSSSSSQLVNPLVSSEWICSFCHWVNDGNLSCCIKCSKEEKRGAGDLNGDDNGNDDEERDFQLGDRVRIITRNPLHHDQHLSPPGYISHVYKCDMYDVVLQDKIEKYIDKESLIREGRGDKLRTQGNGKVYRPCGVCSYLNLATDTTCQVCSIQLLKSSQEKLSEYTFPIGTKVLVQMIQQGQDNEREEGDEGGEGGGEEGGEDEDEDEEDREGGHNRIHCTYEPAIVKETHRYGLYTVELIDSGRILRYLPEDLVSALSPSSELLWKCGRCQNSNKSFFSLEENKKKHSLVMKCSKCGQKKENSSHSHHRQFNYVENVSMMLGAKIEAKYRGSDVYYPGVVTSITKDGLYEIEYDHGEVETDVPEESLIVIAIYCGPF